MSAMDVSFRIGGEAGQGVESSGSGFAQALTRAGLHVFGVPSYYSRIRGGHNYFTIRASDEPVFAAKDTIELLLALNAETVSRHVDALVPGGAIIVDESTEFDPSLVQGRDVHVMSLPMLRIAEEHGSAVMVNTAALAASASVLNLDLGPILSVIEDNFGTKGRAIVESNQRVAQETYDLAKERYGSALRWKLTARETPERLVIGTNQAFAMGALAAGCKFYAGYPMTPSSSVLEYMAGHAAQWGLVVKHAEDEIAAVNMCVGAAHAGVRAMTATSGGGFDLMTEGISLAAMTETPLVIYLAQRPGPATGLATRTSQSDLFLALYAGHGEFPRVLLAPHTPAEAFACAFRAFNIAEKYQCLVVVLSDQYGASSVQSVDKSAFDFDAIPIDRGKLLTAADVEALDDYKRFAITPDGISPRAVPGLSPKAVYLSTGNEHLENGHITEDPQVTTAMLDKRLRKLEGARSEIRAPYRYGPEGAAATLVSWGSSWGPVYEAMQAINRNGGSANMVHFVDLWPFANQAAREALAGAQQLIDVEGNGSAQFAALLQAQTGTKVDHRILKYDGRGFTAQYILDAFHQLGGK
ncbi:MAG: 2-oxoacid:acceptor oxidoreductase subunit alpha [Anaerolineae bacterium]|nr:2-oxoacid:acceptor oxidoreductase subunit alpha [Anaerolineae bacterium]